MSKSLLLRLDFPPSTLHNILADINDNTKNENSLLFSDDEFHIEIE